MESHNGNIEQKFSYDWVVTNVSGNCTYYINIRLDKLVCVRVVAIVAKWLLHVLCFKQDSQDSYSWRKVMKVKMYGSGTEHLYQWTTLAIRIAD